ncbi:type I 3-dehydroquinate dehydratase [Chloroflexota bacterium]
MQRPNICAVIVNNDRSAVAAVAPLVDMYEVRIDLVVGGWTEIVGQMDKPWIACNRRADEGGRWQQSEARRVEELLRAAELGAGMIDIELRTENLTEIVPLIKQRAQCLLSSHIFGGTPALDEMKDVVRRQLDAGADICKVVTTALKPEDNTAVLRLITEFPGTKIVSFAMGPLGAVSRVLCPLVGGYFTYAAIEASGESAAGQMTAGEMRKLYGMVSCG